MKVGIVIQARMGSTRLPNKVLLNFHDNKSILEIIVGNLSTAGLPIVVATSVSNNDQAIVDFCTKKEIDCFRGSENDVLSRFIGVAKEFDFTHVIRVCSDNPFMLPESISALVNELESNQNMDYISYKIGDTPSILTHYGLFAELVSYEAMLESHKSGNSYYREHVTNYVYSHPKLFSIKWLQSDYDFLAGPDFRLTVDSMADFRNAQSVYDEIGNTLSIASIVKILNNSPVLVENMRIQILGNIK